MKTLARCMLATTLLASLAGCAAEAGVAAGHGTTPNAAEPPQYTSPSSALPRNDNPPPEPGPGAPPQRL